MSFVFGIIAYWIIGGFRGILSDCKCVSWLVVRVTRTPLFIFEFTTIVYVVAIVGARGGVLFLQ